MKPLSKHQQTTLTKNRGYPVAAGLAALNAHGKKLPQQKSALALAVAATMSKPK